MRPPKSKSLSPLYADGLWLAEICTPPEARCARTSTPSVGVAATSAYSTRRPHAASGLLARRPKSRAATTSGGASIAAHEPGETAKITLGDVAAIGRGDKSGASHAGHMK